MCIEQAKDHVARRKDIVDVFQQGKGSNSFRIICKVKNDDGEVKEKGFTKIKILNPNPKSPKRWWNIGRIRLSPNAITEIDSRIAELLD